MLLESRCLGRRRGMPEAPKATMETSGDWLRILDDMNCFEMQK